MTYPSDYRSSNTGDAKHRGPKGCPDRSERLAQTATNPWDWTGVTEELGKKHAVSTYFIYLNTSLTLLTAMSKSAPFPKVVCLYFVDTSFTLWWPVTMVLSLQICISCKSVNPLTPSCLHRKPLLKAHWGTQNSTTTWKWSHSMWFSWAWRQNSHSCGTRSSFNLRTTRPCWTQRWSWRLRSRHTDGCWMVETSSE